MTVDAELSENLMSMDMLWLPVTTTGRITERSFYPALISVIGEKGGSGVSEVSFNSEPDIIFNLDSQRWLMGVKIGETPSILKSAFIQYQRHKDESKLNHGLLLFLPESMRKVGITESEIASAIGKTRVACLVDTPTLKEEYSDAPFPTIVERLITEVMPRLERREEKSYSLDLIVQFLQQQVSELIEKISPEDPSILKAIIDRDLLSGIGKLDKKHARIVTQFLGASILLSQIMFLRLYGSAHSGVLPERPITKESLRLAFKQIWDINYRPIYDLDVLDTVSEDYLRETYDLISGLEIEKSRYELPGRMFHALMPPPIRKLMAAFYTRPQSADLLANLTITGSGDTVFDPASGSGTILVAAYRRKLDLFLEDRRKGNPHEMFCQEDIFGADIMPFAVHLTTANLAAMDPATTIKRTQIMHGDSLKLHLGLVQGGIQKRLFPVVAKARTMAGEEYKLKLNKVRAVLMNPPFTKVERGIKEFVDMKRFRAEVGGEVGLWGHFVLLASEFLTKDGDDNGVMGAVLPVSIFRGRETRLVRDFLFSSMTPLYVVKTTLNYGFSELSEYRDVLFVARMGSPEPSHRVKFCLLKFDISACSWDVARQLADLIRSKDRFRGRDLDIESFTIEDLDPESMNLMAYIGVTEYNHRDILLNFLSKSEKRLRPFPEGYLKEGYRLEGGISSVIFLTRNLHASRLRKAFLGFDQDGGDTIVAKSPRDVEYEIEKQALTPSLRTGVGQTRMSIDGRWDYIANRRYDAFPRLVRATGVRVPRGQTWSKAFSRAKRELEGVRTRIVVSRRVNPYSPNVHLLAFFSQTPFSPSDQFKVISEDNDVMAKALCVILNSTIFLANLFLFKEETTGRFIDIRSYDLQRVRLCPESSEAEKLAEVFDEFSDRDFPSLHEQLDQRFLDNYERFWAEKDWEKVDLVVEPSQIRLEFDTAVFEALDIAVTEGELVEVYTTLVKEMIITRGLKKD